jgi:hypothetical protein
MAVFIPEWHKLSARDVHVKRVLASLDDDHVVRRPVRPGCAADAFVQHPASGWLALAVSPVPAAGLLTGGLFENDARERFEQRLDELQRLVGPAEHGVSPLPVVQVMWACSTEEVRLLSREYLGRFGVRLVSRDRYTALGAKLLHGLLAPLEPGDEQRLLASWFPEAEIAAACTTRVAARVDPHDNSARLGRFFLDPDQEWAAKLDLERQWEVPSEQRNTASDFSVRLLNGVAGSGKTIIAVQRALLLAELFPRQRVLVLIHNTPIVADLKDRLHRVHGGSLPGNVEMMTFFAWIHRQWRRVFGRAPSMPRDPHMVAELVRHHRRRWPDLKPSTAQLVAELDFINEALIADEAAYMAASRTGRRFALGAAERAQVWALYEAVTTTLQRRELQLWSALPRALCFARERHASLERFEHIVVDEAQFFAPSWFEVVKLSLAPAGQLFLCADPNQGFLRQRLSWKSAGLDVAGRTKKLRRSYRTTRAILESATRVLALLAPGEGDEYLQPDFDGMAPGEPPRLARAAAPQDAIERLCNELAEAHAAGMPLGAFLVVYGDSVNKGDLYASLARRFGRHSVWWFNEREQKREPPRGHGHDYLRMAYLDTATGLEAGIVFLIGVEDLLSGGGNVVGLDDQERAERREAHARKLYMAMTRAGHRLVVLSARRLPPEMEALFSVGERE